MSHSFLFAIAKSRLGLRSVNPEESQGVIDGGEALYSKLPSEITANSKKLNLDFPAPTELDQENFLPDMFFRYLAARNSILQNWEDRRLAFFGGDHGAAFISLSAAIEKFGSENTAVVMFDSHADINLPETSPSGNYHGMWLRGFFEIFTNFDQFYPPKRLLPNQLRFVGNLILDPAEEEFIAENQVTNYSSDKISDLAGQDIAKWASEFSHLHISFDIDVFAQSLVSATGTPNPNGLTEEQVFMMLEPLLKHPSISFDIIEYNPGKPGAEETLKQVERVLLKLVS